MFSWSVLPKSQINNYMYMYQPRDLASFTIFRKAFAQITTGALGIFCMNLITNENDLHNYKQ